MPQVYPSCSSCQQLDLSPLSAPPFICPCSAR
jgi:hypothetical protein